MTTFGKISLDKNHPLNSQHLDGISISPFAQSLVLQYCAEVVPNKACSLLNTALGSEIFNSSQAYRLIHEYGEVEEVESILTDVEEVKTTTNKTSDELGSTNEIIYAMLDGGMVPFDDGYHEVKVGRKFTDKLNDRQVAENQQTADRKTISSSRYLMREGHYVNFTTHFEKLINSQLERQPNSQLVFVSDGAAWMQDWVEQKFPNATHVLDFYHVFERICNFAIMNWKDSQERNRICLNWKQQLLGGEVHSIIKEFEGFLISENEKIAELAKAVLFYLNTKKHRMKYDEYLRNGYRIGSGAIESAIRSAVQQRCKLSGQRWNNGLQAVLNIRAIKLSGKWEEFEKIIIKKHQYAA